MDLNEQVREALLGELRRQADEGWLTLAQGEGDNIKLEGQVDLQSLAMAVIGAVAGGP